MSIKWRRGMIVRNGFTRAAKAWRDEADQDSHEAAGWRLVRPADDDREAWALFVPDGPLPDTGPKELAVGQVWAIRTTIKEGKIVRIDGMGRDGDGDKIATLCGKAWSGPLMVDGCIKRAVLLFDAPASSQPVKPVERRLAAGWTRNTRDNFFCYRSGDAKYDVRHPKAAAAYRRNDNIDGACEACAESMGVFADEPAFVGPGVADLLKPMQRELDRICATLAPVRCGHCPHGRHVGPCPGSSPSGDWSCPCGAVKTEAKGQARVVGKYDGTVENDWDLLVKTLSYERHPRHRHQADVVLLANLARERAPRRELPKVRDIYSAGASMDGTE